MVKRSDSYGMEMTDRDGLEPLTVSIETGQGGTGKRAVYEPDGAQRCKQVVCSRNWAVAIVVIFCFLVVTIAVIAAFARPNKNVACIDTTAPTPTDAVVPTEAIATNGEKFPWDSIKLPRTVKPQNYDLTIHPNLTTFHFSGTVSIDIHVKESTPFVVFHAKKLNITSYKMYHFQSTKSLPISRFLHYPAHEQYYLELERRLQQRSQYTMMMTFEGYLSDLMVGFYRSSYTTVDGEQRYIAVTQFEATDARAAFPCFDEPDMKAGFTLTMIREPRHVALFNMPKVNTEELEGGLLQDRFETSVIMSTYLVAFIICDFPKITNYTSRHIAVSVYAPEDQLDQAYFALDAAITVLEYFELFFGQIYPLPKLDLIAIPDFGPGAMENWGLITYRQTALLYDPKVSTSQDQKRVAVVVAHEVAHQWFGNLVTMEWWNDLWLNEGFASFVQYIGADRVKPEWQMMDQFVADELVDALYRDSLSDSHPISVSVQDPAEISELFDAISYRKGASIIRMLEGMIGRNSLQQGLKDYLQKYHMSNAATDDLWDALNEHTTEDVDIKSLMDTWTLQMGYPVVMVSGRNNHMVAQQAPFRLNPKVAVDTTQSPFGYQWQIPLTYVTDQSPSPSPLILMKDDSHTFTVPEDIRWLKMNVNFTGYYRVHYNQNNWKALAAQLSEDHLVFSTADRAQLLDDAFSLSRAGYMGACTAIQLAEYLHKELSFVPWTVTIFNLQYISDLLEGKEAFEDFRFYINSLVQDVLSILGWDPIEDYLSYSLRSKLLHMAVNYNLDFAVKRMKNMFDDWMVNGTDVPTDMKVAVYQAGIQYGGDREWDFMWNKYTTTRVPSEKRHLLKAMAATTDLYKVDRYLKMSLEEDKVRLQDTIALINYVAHTSPGRTLAWAFVKQNWKEILRRYDTGGFEFTNLVDGLLPGFSTQYDYEELKQFFEGHPARTGKRTIKQGLELVQMNIAWLERNEHDVSTCLREFVERKQQGTESTDQSATQGA